MHTADHPEAPLLSVRAALGNVADGEWPARLRGSRVDVLPLDAAEAQRSRLRKQTAGGIDVAIALERGVHLRDGDVLGWDETRRAAVVVRVDLPDVMVVDLSALLGARPETLLARSVDVGHALGNQHWPAVAKGPRVYVPVAASQEVMETVMETHRIEGVSWWFASGAEVSSELAPQEAGLLFADATGHAHSSAGSADGVRS
jgi:urease accessory protein